AIYRNALPERKVEIAYLILALPIAYFVSISVLPVFTSVLWFDVAGVPDLGTFLAHKGIKGVTGMYQAGFFPVMMFGLPAGAYAIYRNALPERKVETASLMMAGAFASFIPTGLHQALNSVFWFDVAGINDIGKFLAHKGIKGVTGMYQAGFFPVMMFGLPAGAYAIYRNALPERKVETASLMMAGAFASFIPTGLHQALNSVFWFDVAGINDIGKFLAHKGIKGVTGMYQAVFFRVM
ncbi:hypothetical protein WP50_19520, partial [Lactiplantibacillus plantarum]